MTYAMLKIWKMDRTGFLEKQSWISASVTLFAETKSKEQTVCAVMSQTNQTKHTYNESFTKTRRNSILSFIPTP